MSEAPNMKEVKRVAVIGTGVAGLSVAKALLSEGLDCALFERSERLGGVWAVAPTAATRRISTKIWGFWDFIGVL